MPSRITLALTLVLASGLTWAATNECLSDCEQSYKACASSGKMSERQCRVTLEKCRKACAKKAESTG